jgi:Na+/melibiose symporter-like transporter
VISYNRCTARVLPTMSIVFVILYPIDREEHAEVRRELERRHVQHTEEVT